MDCVWGSSRRKDISETLLLGPSWCLGLGERKRSPCRVSGEGGELAGLIRWSRAP